MSAEWQPARVNPQAHAAEPNEVLRGIRLKTPERMAEDRKKIFMVRVCDNPPSFSVEWYRSKGCDSKRFYEFRDICNIGCEHEILTD